MTWYCIWKTGTFALPLVMEKHSHFPISLNKLQYVNIQDKALTPTSVLFMKVLFKYTVFKPSVFQTRHSSPWPQTIITLKERWCSGSPWGTITLPRSWWRSSDPTCQNCPGTPQSLGWNCVKRWFHGMGKLFPLRIFRRLNLIGRPSYKAKSLGCVSNSENGHHNE